MTDLRTRALTIFEEDVENKKAIATRHFKRDFEIDPDEITYLGKCWFLFRVNDLYIKGYIEWRGGFMHYRYYKLAALCREPHCERLIVDKKSFFHDLIGLGEAINDHQDLGCDVCARAWAD